MAKAFVIFNPIHAKSAGWDKYRSFAHCKPPLRRINQKKPFFMKYLLGCLLRLLHHFIQNCPDTRRHRSWERLASSDLPAHPGRSQSGAVEHHARSRHAGPDLARRLDFEHNSKIEQVEAALCALGLRLDVSVVKVPKAVA